jgi:hypothetical protein
VQENAAILEIFAEIPQKFLTSRLYHGLNHRKPQIHGGTDFNPCNQRTMKPFHVLLRFPWLKKDVK